LPEKVRAASPLFLSLAPAGNVRIAVKDSGAGLSPQQLAEICAEGVQFNPNELQAGQGSGLGLFISKGIVEQHGGKLVVTSEGLGKGATFTIALPSFHARPGSPMDSSTPVVNLTQRLSGAAHPQVIAAAMTRKSLLLVDDSAPNRKMLVRLLSAKGYVCEQAEDGAVAVRKYVEMVERGEPPDAILMDYEMPVMNGPSATARLRELGCACLIVGVTGNLLPQDVAFFKESGADAVLPKPIVLEDFERRLQGAASSSHGSAWLPRDEGPVAGVRHKGLMPSTTPQWFSAQRRVCAVDESRGGEVE
jgi:CheY-like chemotaxis protein